MDRLDKLKKEHNNNEDIPVQFVRKAIGQLIHSKRMNYPSDLNQSERMNYMLKNANHRKILLTEVVFDIDADEKEIQEEVKDWITSQLKKYHVSYELYQTGSKRNGYHIHTFFPELARMKDPQERKNLRREMLQYFGYRSDKNYSQYIDYQKTSDNVMIRMEGGIHEVTENEKKLVDKYKSDMINIVPPRCRKKHQHKWKAMQERVFQIKNIEIDASDDFALMQNIPYKCPAIQELRNKNTHLKHTQCAGLMFLYGQFGDIGYDEVEKIIKLENGDRDENWNHEYQKQYHQQHYDSKDPKKQVTCNTMRKMGICNKTNCPFMYISEINKKRKKK